MYMYMYMYVCVYIYIYIYRYTFELIKAGRDKFGSIRFGSGLFIRQIIGWVGLGLAITFPGSTWFGMCFSDAS